MRWPFRRRKPPPPRRPLPGWPAAAPPDSLADDLRRHIFESLYAVPPADRQAGLRWVMSLEWLLEIRRLDASRGPLYHPPVAADAPDYLLGIPVAVRDHGGPPHLEPVSQYPPRRIEMPDDRA